MNKKELQKLAGIVTENYGFGTMTEEAIKDVKKSVSLLFDRLLTDERMGDEEARRVVNQTLQKVINQMLQSQM